MMMMKKMKLKLKVNRKKIIITKMMKYLKIKFHNFLIQINCIKNRPNL